MSEKLAEVLGSMAERLIALAAADATLRDELRRLAAALLEALPAPAEEAGLVPEPATPPAVPLPPPPPPEPLPPLRFGSQVSEVPSPALEAERFAAAIPVADADLGLIEQRCRMKAEGARWAATRQRRMSEGADFQMEIQPKDREVIEKAKRLPDCFLWMNHPDNPPPADLELLDNVAECFDVAADALALQRQLLDEVDCDRTLFEQSLDLLAEAQSALRAAIERIDGPRDNDQQQVFNWLRATAAEHQIFIQRYMRASDRADPTNWRDLAGRIDALDSQLQELRQREKQRRGRIKKVRYHAQQIATGRSSGLHDWNIIIDTVEEIVRDGIPPSNRELRDTLAPIIETLPEREIPEGFQLVLREIDRYLASRAPAADGQSAAASNEEVRAAAELLRGKTLVLIGGDRRPHAHQALMAAFGLADLVWVETREHQSLSTFEPHVARGDVVAVLLAIRWSSHSYGEVKDFCDRYGKPLVRLPAGYSPNQIAHQLLQQCGQRLRDAANATTGFIPVER